MSRRLLLCVLLASTTILSACSEKGDGLVKHQVTGKVLINGKPYKNVVVSFFATDPNVKGNAATPIAATAEDGTFTLSTNGENDGAVAGDYRVTFFWQDGGSGMTDYLRGKYSNIDGTKFKVSIGSGEQQLKAFELETTEANIAAASKALASQRKSVN